jgi:hypothetical protein
MSGAQVHLEAGGTFVQDPQKTLFSLNYKPRDVYVAETFEVPIDRSKPEFGGTVSASIPSKADIVRRLTLRSELPQLYTPLGPGYVYPLYTDQVDGSVYVDTNTLAIQPGDFVGYFNTQFLSAWATNFVGYVNISVAYDSSVQKFVFTSPTYSNIVFRNEQSASFWGFDIRSPDFLTTVGSYPGYNFSGGTLTAPLTVIQAGWIRGFTPPPTTGFSYVDSVGTKLIKSVELKIGGKTIDRLTSERLYLQDDLGVAYENQAGLTILEGKNDTSVISAPREYYTRLNFDMDVLNMAQLYRQDVRLDVEYEKFENLPSSYISSNGFLDGASYVTSNLQALTGDAGQNFDPDWSIGWKNYIIMGPLLNNSFRFYNQDTGTWYKWTPGDGTSAFVKTNGGTIYGSKPGSGAIGGGALQKADLTTVLATSTTPWTIGYNPFNSFPSNPDGDGINVIRPSSTSIITDARYVYMFYQVNYFIIGSTYTSIVSGSLDGTLKIWTIVYRFYNKSGSLSASDQTALSAFWTSYCGAFTSAVITGYANSGSDLLVTGTLTYSTNQTSGNQNIPGHNVHNNLIWVRYDTTASFTSASSYTWPLTNNNLPASIKDIFPGTYDTLQLPNTAYYFMPTFDGRYIYFATAGYYVAKMDTQNFLSMSAYTQVNGASLSPNPIDFCDGPYISDGRYLYVSSKNSGSGTLHYFARYDSTKVISQQTSWEYFTGDTSPRTDDYTSIPCGFDGKYIYYYTQSSLSIRTMWHKYDTTKPFNSVSSWEWIINYTNGTTLASNGTNPQITMLSHRTDLSPSDPYYASTVRYIRFITGSRYIYITSTDGRGFKVTLQDFIQYNPVTMSNTLSSSILVKYEKYVDQPKPTKALYGQSDVEEFIMRTGRDRDTFQLRFLGPVSEFWVAIDTPGVISRLILRLNNEVLIDDDQATARYIRPFETHTTMPTSNVCTYSLALDPEKLASSGSLNMSRIAYPILEVFLVSPVSSDTKLRVHARSFNVLEYKSGVGGLLFNSTL